MSRRVYPGQQTLAIHHNMVARTGEHARSLVARGAVGGFGMSLWAGELVTAADEELLRVELLMDGEKGPEEWVMRPWLLRATMDSRDGITFTYVTTQQRDATDGVIVERQQITPSYRSGDELLIAPVHGGIPVTTDPDPPNSPTIVYWIDVTPGRDWAAKPTEATGLIVS